MCMKLPSERRNNKLLPDADGLHVAAANAIRLSAQAAGLIDRLLKLSDKGPEPKVPQAMRFFWWAAAIASLSAKMASSGRKGGEDKEENGW